MRSDAVQWPYGYGYYCCLNCGVVDRWGPGWRHFGGQAALEAGQPIKAVCSDQCERKAKVKGAVPPFRAVATR